MIKFFPLILIALLLSFSESHAYSLVNMGSDFKIYVNIYRNSKFDEQWSGWKVFEKKYQKYFDAAICDSSDGDCESAKKTHLKEFFTQLPNFESEMWTIFDNANILSDNQILQFKIYFPDTPTDVPIVFMPSLLTFNGKGGVQIDGTYTLVIGADLAALRKNNMKVLFSHEFFHTYQFGKLTGAPLFQTLASPLWFEGLAVWVSEKLNPEASDADILMSQDLATYCASNEHVIGMAKDYKSFLPMKYSDPTADSIKSDWFYANGNALPHRRGYCLGLQVVRELNKTMPIFSVVGDDESKFSELINKSLDSMTAF